MWGQFYRTAGITIWVRKVRQQVLFGREGLALGPRSSVSRLLEELLCSASLAPPAPPLPQENKHGESDPPLLLLNQKSVRAVLSPCSVGPAQPICFHCFAGLLCNRTMTNTRN